MLGILCGIRSEAVIARKVVGSTVACAGARPQRARWLARELVKKGATYLLSFGIAGGLETGLPVGSLVIGTQVMSTDGMWDCDKGWVNRLSQQLPEAHCGTVWGSETVIAAAADKLALYRKSHCLTVDMESQCVAQVAAETKLPMAVVRVVCDEASMDVPPAVINAIAEDGSVLVGKTLASLFWHPTQLPDLLQLMGGSRKALRVMRGSVPSVTRAT
jgi:hopanoid-associated phosphorylase